MKSFLSANPLLEIGCGGMAVVEWLWWNGCGGMAVVETADRCGNVIIKYCTLQLSASEAID